MLPGCAFALHHALSLSSLSRSSRILQAFPSTAHHAAFSSGQPSAAASPVDTFQLQIILKAFELRYIKEASTVIRDLVLLNVSPKSGDLFSGHRTRSSKAANLFFPISDAKIPTQITRFTLLSSPHVNKTAREQFERRVHKRCITAPTTSYHELQWLVDSITSYDFSGVQIQLDITNSTYLQPASTETSYGSVLSQHMLQEARTFELGRTRYSSADSADDEIVRKLDAAAATISDPQVQRQVRSLVVAINEVLLKLRLPGAADSAATARAVAQVVGQGKAADRANVRTVAKYGQLLQKVAEMQQAAEEGKSADERLAGIYDAVAKSLVAKAAASAAPASR
jgi:ribosomal protein S10